MIKIARNSIYDACMPVKMQQYPNGDPYIKYGDLRYFRKLLIQPESLTEFMAALFFVDALQDRGAIHPDGLNVLIPFLPGSRQDRLFGDGDVLFAAKSIAKEINARSFARVFTLDAHSEVSVGMIDRCYNVPAEEMLDIASRNKIQFPEYAGIISPDAGAEKRASGFAKKLTLPVIHGWKSRDVATGMLKGFGVEPLEAGKHYLIVDDICDGGGTFLGLQEVIEAMGCTADLYVTHGIFSQGTEKLLEKFGNIYTTDSTTFDKQGVTVIGAVSEGCSHGGNTYGVFGF